MRSVRPEQVSAGGGGGAELYASFSIPSSSCCLHQVREQGHPFLQELQHLPVLLLDVSWEGGGGGGGEGCSIRSQVDFNFIKGILQPGKTEKGNIDKDEVWKEEVVNEECSSRRSVQRR